MWALFVFLIVEVDRLSEFILFNTIGTAGPVKSSVTVFIRVKLIVILAVATTRGILVRIFRAVHRLMIHGTIATCVFRCSAI